MSSRILAGVVRFRRPLIVVMHVAIVFLTYYLAYGLRHNYDIPPDVWTYYTQTVTLLVVLRVAVFGWMRLFHGYWQHYGFHDMLATAKAVSISSVAFVIVIAGYSLDAVPDLSVVMLEWLLAIVLVGGVHVAARYVLEGHVPLRERPGRRALIVGAGEAAERLLRQFRHDARLDINPVGLVDDDPHKRGISLHGVRVLGSTGDIGWLVNRYNVSLLVIAVPSASRAQMRVLTDACLATGLDFKVIRPLRELMDGRSPLGQLRDVQIEDLLGRAPVNLELTPVVRDFEGAVVLVTGGAGSIGSELARQVARLHPARLVLFDQAESPLHYIRLELAANHPHLQVAAVIGDVADEMRLATVFAAHRPTHVLHAAAYKHVPLMEENVLESIRNNVFGTLRTARAAARFGARRFVLLSTDKAVNPSSVMGASKRIAERIILGLEELRASGTDFRAVRFGNVLGSEGSVVPIFKRQLASGGQLTVTDPAVTRYFMTIPEAVQLVLQAAILPEASGRVAMLDMGEPVRIAELAENLIRLSGLEPNRDVQITFTGLRPGEKLHEDLMSAYEEGIATSIPQVRTVRRADTDAASLLFVLDRMAAALVIGSDGDALSALRAGVPECVPPLRQPAAGIPSLADVLAPLPVARPVGRTIDDAEIRP